MGAINKIGSIIFSLVWFIAGVFMINLTWNWALTFAGVIEDSFYLGLYWVSLILIILATVFLPPFAVIISSFKQEVVE